MKKVIFLTPSLNMGGAERWVLTLAENFTRVRTHAILNLMGQDNDVLNDEASKICPVHICHNNIPKINEYCAEADVVISWGCPQLPKLSIDCPVIEVSHSDPTWPLHKNLINKTICGATHYVGVSQTASKAFPDFCDSVTLYNGIDLNRLKQTKSREQMRSEWNINSQRLVLFTGGDKAVKNPKVIVETAKILPDNYLMLYVSNRHFESKGLKVIPPDIQIGNLYHAADVLAMPSMYEGMPLVLLEAWAAGLPTVTTKYDAYRELAALHSQELSWTTEVSPKPDELAHQIQEAYYGKDLDRVLDAQSIVLENYTTQHMVDRWENYLLGILNDSES